jgi:hypothetical protein
LKAPASRQLLPCAVLIAKHTSDKPLNNSPSKSGDHAHRLYHALSITF